MNVVESIKAQAPPPSGVYIGVVTGAPQAINDSGRKGVRFVIEVAEGPTSGRRATVELITELKVGGNRARMLSDHVALGEHVVRALSRRRQRLNADRAHRQAARRGGWQAG